MNEGQDRQQIRNVIETRIEATKKGDFERVLTLMSEDVVFLLPGQQPMRGRAAYAAASQSTKGKFQFDGKPEIQEIQITGNYAYCWNYLSVTLTPVSTGTPKRLAGNIVSVFRKEPDGRWVLFRDANMLTPV